MRQHPAGHRAAGALVLVLLITQAAASDPPPHCLYAGGGISFYGADMAHEQVAAASASTCCFLCAATPKCVAFEWNPAVNGGTCFLKDGTGVVPRVFEGAQSGVLVAPGTAISAAAIQSNNAAMAGGPGILPPSGIGSLSAAGAAPGLADPAAGSGGCAGSGLCVPQQAKVDLKKKKKK